MIHVFACVQARADAAEALRRVFEPLVAASRAESGCLSYELFRAADDPASFRTAEIWRDAAALETHMASAHVAAAFAQAASLLAAAPVIHRCERVL
jgi:quinol monooxygenase YgiN